MSKQEQRIENLNKILHQIISDWYERVKEGFVTEQDSRDVGVEPEIKHFHDNRKHRIKFLREKKFDVTYGLAAAERGHCLVIESSINNKSAGFDYDIFAQRLKSHYWKNRCDKPWTNSPFNRFSYEDLLLFEPVIGKSVKLDCRKDKADIIRLYFIINPEHECLLFQSTFVLRELVVDYCLGPLKLIYVESYQAK